MRLMRSQDRTFMQLYVEATGLPVACSVELDWGGLSSNRSLEGAPPAVELSIEEPHLVAVSVICGQVCASLHDVVVEDCRIEYRPM